MSYLKARLRFYFYLFTLRKRTCRVIFRNFLFEESKKSMIVVKYFLKIFSFLLL